MPQDSVAYAVARTRVLEAKLISQERLRRMLDAPDAETVMRALQEVGYGNVQDQKDYETMITGELIQACEYIRSVTPNPLATNIFFLKYDCHNVKMILKTKMLGKSAKGALMDTGTVPVPKLEDALSTHNYSVLPKHMSAAAKQVDGMIEAGNADPFEMDCILDSACFADMAEGAEQSGDALALAIVRAQADLFNFKTLLRMRKIGAAAQVFSIALVPGGSIARRTFMDSFNSSDEVLVRQLGLNQYGNTAVLGMEEYMRKGSLGLLEKLTDDYITGLVSSHKYESFSLAPILGYMLAKEREAQAVRLVIVSKLNRVPADMVVERLRELYE